MVQETVTIGADELLRRKIRALMEQHRLSQIELAAKIGRSQAWLSRKITGVQNFYVRDLDRIATVFGITVPELFFDTYGQWDRRSNTDRRKGERRQRRQTIFDPTIEPSRAISRIAFDPKSEESGQ